MAVLSTHFRDPSLKGKIDFHTMDQAGDSKFEKWGREYDRTCKLLVDSVGNIKAVGNEIYSLGDRRDLLECIIRIHFVDSSQQSYRSIELISADSSLSESARQNLIIQLSRAGFECQVVDATIPSMPNLGTFLGPNSGMSFFKTGAPILLVLSPGTPNPITLAIIDKDDSQESYPQYADKFRNGKYLLINTHKTDGQHWAVIPSNGFLNVGREITPQLELWSANVSRRHLQIRHLEGCLFHITIVGKHGATILPLIKDLIT